MHKQVCMQITLACHKPAARSPSMRSLASPDTKSEIEFARPLVSRNMHVYHGIDAPSLAPAPRTTTIDNSILLRVYIKSRFSPPPSRRDPLGGFVAVFRCGSGAIDSRGKEISGRPREFHLRDPFTRADTCVPRPEVRNDDSFVSSLRGLRGDNGGRDARREKTSISISCQEPATVGCEQELAKNDVTLRVHAACIFPSLF